MTEDQILIIESLNTCKLLPGSWNKRFIKSIVGIFKTEPNKVLSEQQNEWLYRLVYTYRRQIPEIYNKFRHIPQCAAIAETK